MAGERTYAILPCRTLEDVVPFYARRRPARAALDEARALPFTGDERELLAVELATVDDLTAG